ncbi:MAG TPA: hypothetical protein PLS51_01840 [Flavobacterium sp.]|jgi:hypothetical protein|nr:hypothetical protein [Flavobacterium sp.]
MRKLILFALLIVGSVAFAQPSVNDYEYVVVPTQFKFSNKKDEFRLNTLTKMLLQKYGFKAFLDSEPQPDEIVDSNCKKLYADVESNSGLRKTRVRVVLKDCKNKILFISDEGTSLEKDWGKAYNEAIRAAFESLGAIHYKYKPAVAASPDSGMVTQPGSGTVAESLFAQPIANGFQLVDSTPKVVMKIFKTSDSNRFSAVRGEVHGDLIKRDGQWFFDYFQNDQLVSQAVDVKF